MDDHIKKICKFYEEETKRMIECIDKNFAESCKRTNPEGDLFVWVTLPDCLDAMEIWHELMEAGVGVVSSKNFAPDPQRPGNAFRLNYFNPSLEEIEKGYEIMGKVLSDKIGREQHL